MTASVAVFGSAFNPPSLGHLSVLERLTHFDQVLLLPSYTHAWGKKMLDYDVRCELVAAFIEDSQLNNVTLSRIEQKIANGNDPVTTYAVLDNLQRKMPDANLTFIVGPDNFLNFSKFYRSDEIMKRWQVLACPETVPIRSTVIRDAIVNSCDISHLTTPKVAKLIMNKALYQTS